LSTAGLVAGVHVFDPANSTWTDISDVVLGIAPLPSCSYGITSANGNLYLHGGYDKGINPPCDVMLSSSQAIWIHHCKLWFLPCPASIFTL
jgi:hypothetical protein